MTSSCKDNIENYYQLADGVAPAGTELANNELIDFATGLPLVDDTTDEVLTGDSLETIVLTDSGKCTPIVISDDPDYAVLVNVTNKPQSEVEVSLLGIPKQETALALFDTVNIYGVNSKEWVGTTNYTYFRDPPEYTFDDPYGYYARHVPTESAIQIYAFPKRISFIYPFDDNSGRFPGGYTNGVQSGSWESVRAFRYQPGRVTGFTLGVRMSTLSQHDGEVIQWGCRNTYGDSYYFQLERGTDLYIIRASPGLGTLKVPRKEWSGDKVFVGTGRTGWGLDLSRVTMFKIEFSWYGAVGAKFLAYVPDGNGEGRWVKLHYISAENRFEQPSLRSAYLRLFTSVVTTAGTNQAAFINLYGSSVYIDGGDKGTVILGTAALEAPKIIDQNSRSLIGLNVKGSINGVPNQKAVYPVTLSAYASVPTRFDLIYANGCSLQYGYGPGTSISRGASSAIAVTTTGDYQLNVASGTFPDITGELIGSLDYYSGRRVKVEGTGIFKTHVTAINPGLTQITTDRPLPSGTTSVRLSRMNAYAIASGIITSGVTQGSFFIRPGGYTRLGLWPQASGVYDTSKKTIWVTAYSPTLTYSYFTGLPDGETGGGVGCGQTGSYTIVVNSGTPSYTISVGGNSLVVSGSSNPWPIAVVAELMDGASYSDVTVIEGSTITTAGVGATKAITSFATSGVSQSSAAAGGTFYTAHKFEDALCDPLSAVVADRQGSKILSTDNRVASYFIGGNETKQFDLANVFGPDKMFITGAPGSIFNTGTLFVMATSRTGSGIASAMLNWEEQ
jgi:hypothetical protein